MVAYIQRPEVLGLAFGVNGFSEDSKSKGAPEPPKRLRDRLAWDDLGFLKRPILDLFKKQG